LNRLESNLLLAISTGVALLLLLMTASVFGAPGQAAKYVVLAAVCAGAFVALNGWMARLMKRPEPRPMIRPETPASAAWAGLFPLAVIAAAAVPVFFPGRDYGLLIILASIWFGVTADSARRARGG